MTPAEREELTGLRTLLEYALHRVDVVLGAPPDAEPVPHVVSGLNTDKTTVAILRVLSESKRPMQAIEVHNVLVRAGRSVNPNAVYQNLLRFSKEGKIQRVGHGRYAALGWKP